MDQARTIPEKYVTLFDTAKRCLLIIDQLYADFTQGLDSLTENDGEKQDQSKIIRLYACAHGLIDFCHRYMQVIEAMPLLSKKRVEVKKLVEMCSEVTECRNYIQHIRNHLMSDDRIDYPILGSISWIKEDRNYVLFPNQATQGHSIYGITYDTWNKKYVCKYQITISKYQLRIDLIYNELKKFWEWLSSVSQIEPASVKEYQWGRAGILYSRLTEAKSITMKDH